VRSEIRRDETNGHTASSIQFAHPLKEAAALIFSGRILLEVRAVTCNHRCSSDLHLRIPGKAMPRPEQGLPSLPPSPMVILDVSGPEYFAPTRAKIVVRVRDSRHAFVQHCFAGPQSLQVQVLPAPCKTNANECAQPPHRDSLKETRKRLQLQNTLFWVGWVNKLTRDCSAAWTHWRPTLFHTVQQPGNAAVAEAIIRELRSRGLERCLFKKFLVTDRGLDLQNGSGHLHQVQSSQSTNPDS
jgi:hypothetical protein